MFLGAQVLVMREEGEKLGVLELFLGFQTSAEMASLSWALCLPVSSLCTGCPLSCPLFLARLRIGDI